MSPRPRKKPSNPYRIYVTYLPDGRYYIGYSNKTDKLFEQYFGSSRAIKEVIIQRGTDELYKEIIAEFTIKSHAKMQEFLLQWKYRDDERCLNDMIHIRLKMSYLTEFNFIDWQPRTVTYQSYHHIRHRLS